MKKLNCNPIGKIKSNENGFYIVLDKKYIPALTGLDGFGYIQVLWWFDGCDNDLCRGNLTEEKPYKKGPATLGVFATRSPERPNPLALSSVPPLGIDFEKGMIELSYIDAEDGSPVLDIKPYTPCLDRAENPVVPAWCAHWPQNIEGSGEFDWDAEFNF